jgi:hypothetical protein
MFSHKQWAALMNLKIYRHYAASAITLKAMLSHHALSHSSQFGIAVNGKSHAKSGKHQSMDGVLNSAPNRKGNTMDDFDLDMLEAELNALTPEQQAELEAEFEALRNSDDWEKPF